MINYYQCLGVTSNASSEQVKMAYKEFAKNFHPDKHNNSDFFKQRFQEIQQAYEILADSAKRKIYDLKFAKHAIIDDARIKELTLKVNKLENAIKQKNDSVSNLIAIIAKKDTELNAANSKLSDYLSQIRVLTEYIAAEKGRIRRKNNPLIGLIAAFQNYAPIIYIVLGLVAVVAVSNFAKKRYGFGEDKIDMNKVVVMADTLARKKEYTLLINNINELMSSKMNIDTTVVSGGIHSEKVDLYTIRAYANELAGNFKEAKKDIDYVIENRRVSSGYAYYRRAHLSFATKSKNNLLNDLNKAIRIEPSLIAAYQLRGEFNFNMGDVGAAIKDFRVVYNARPNDFENLNNIGNCYYAMQKYKSACSIWKKANDLGSKEAYYSLRRNCR